MKYKKTILTSICCIFLIAIVIIPLETLKIHHFAQDYTFPGQYAYETRVFHGDVPYDDILDIKFQCIDGGRLIILDANDLGVVYNETSDSCVFHINHLRGVFLLDAFAAIDEAKKQRCQVIEPLYNLTRSL